MSSRPPMLLRSGRILDFSGPALIMAIVNCNTDSFYSPSRALGERAVEMALAAEEDGASIIDFGAESSRPGSSGIGGEEELAALVPVIRSFRKHSDLPVSVDTRKAEVARAVLDEGTDIINDISGLTDDPGMTSVCAAAGAAVVLVHKKQDAPHYGDLPAELCAFFKSAAARAIAAGIRSEQIILDPGIGFGKTLNDNLEILRLGTGSASSPRLAEICGKDYPVLAGLSRKIFIGEITGRDAADRLPGTLAANAAAIIGGADIIRVHDVKEHVDLVKMLFALGPGN